MLGSWSCSCLACRPGERHRLSPLGALLQVQADLVIEIVRLALQAVDAFVRVDLAERMDGLHRAAPRTDVAFRSAFPIALQPFEHAHARRDRQRSAKRAEVTAVEALDEQAGEQ